MPRHHGEKGAWKRRRDEQWEAQPWSWSTSSWTSPAWAAGAWLPDAEPAEPAFAEGVPGPATAELPALALTDGAEPVKDLGFTDDEADRLWGDARVVLTDLMMPRMSGIDLIKALATVAPDAEVVVMTAHGTIETAVEAMRAGAYDFVEKPLRRLQIVKTVRKAAERHALVEENRTLRKELSALRGATSRRIVGSSSSLRAALEIATQAAPSTATVLVFGESGTGKELLARHVHERSGLEGPFVAVNLAALPETILESELFGHEKGAFTGAVAKRVGRIAQATGGTLFLDEIGELSPAVQVKLLRVLQERVYEPLGGKSEQAEFRLIAATNRDLRAAVESGEFREDLYYRLNVIAVTSPPLRDRRDDIPLLVDHFLEVYSRKNGREYPSL